MLAETDTLIVRHLPDRLSNSEKVEFLEYFGAKEVRVMPHRGRMRHTAFATFKDSEDANKAISRLHQVEIYGSVLSVEFSKLPPTRYHQDKTADSSIVTNADSQKGLKQSEQSTAPKADIYIERKSVQKTIATSAVASHLGIHYPSDPGIKYRYPPANGDILLNISSALAAVPRFYVQVLHLMNKMHLLPPFSPTTTVPPLILDRLKEIWPSLPLLQEPSIFKEPDKVEVVEMSESESEYESNESEGESKLKTLDMDVPERVIKSRKRKSKSSSGRTLKKKRMTKLLTQATPIDVPSEPKTAATVSDAFDDSSVASIRKHIEINVQALPTDESSNFIDDERCNEGFGKFNPMSVVESACEKQNISEDKILKDFITLKQLSDGRLSEKDMRSSTLFQSYKKGDPNCRLYVKNLSKRVTEKDLEFIYGSFVNYKNEHETNMFDVQLLTQGRMKGQAFVGFSTVEAATAALNATNGYQLMNKAMVVHYARSKKPKEQSQG